MRSRPLHRNNPNALMADYDPVAFSDVEKLHCSGGAFFPVNRNRTVHRGGADFDLLPVKSNERFLVGRHIKITRENSLLWPLGHLCLVPLDNFAAVLSPLPNPLVY